MNHAVVDAIVEIDTPGGDAGGDVMTKRDFVIRDETNIVDARAIRGVASESALAHFAERPSDRRVKKIGADETTPQLRARDESFFVF